MLEIFERARNLNDAQELVSLYIGRVEAELGAHGLRPDLAVQWRSSSVRRKLDVNEVLNLRATARFFKELFNFFFRDDLYGVLRLTAIGMAIRTRAGALRRGQPLPTMRVAASNAFNMDRKMLR
jgi:hypothetical protein